MIPYDRAPHELLIPYDGVNLIKIIKINRIILKISSTNENGHIILCVCVCGELNALSSLTVENSRRIYNCISYFKYKFRLN